MFKIMAFLSKREDIETRAFIEYYEHHHVPLIREPGAHSHRLQAQLPGAG